MFKVNHANSSLFSKIRIMANPTRFKILELTQNKTLTITELNKETNLAYNKCADYIRELEKENLIKKTKKGRNTLIKAKIQFKKIQI